ncbi:MAG: nucleotidyltransferase domain-containing protein [Phycisphaerae bacterium]|nr:nucleotidyltransferase domain-containing protein [Phycisphaerae bacterium]
MISMKDIRALGRRIVLDFPAQRVILFGSYAYGRPTEDSDVDLLVVMAFKGHPAYKSAEVLLRIAPSFPTDILVRTPGYVRKRVAMGDSFMQEILARGKVLYEGHHARMDRKSGRRLRNDGARTASPKVPELQRRLFSRTTVR